MYTKRVNQNSLVDAWVKLETILNSDKDIEGDDETRDLKERSVLMSYKRARPFSSVNKRANNVDSQILTKFSSPSDNIYKPLQNQQKNIQTFSNYPSLQQSQLFSKRELSIKLPVKAQQLLNGSIIKQKQRPMTAYASLNKLQFSGMVDQNQQLEDIGVLEEDNIIHSLKIEEIVDLYEAKCQDNKIEFLPNQGHKFVEKIKKSFIDTKFELKEQNFGYYSACVLAKIFQNNTYFSHLNLTRNLLSDKGTTILAQALKDNNTLIHLDLSSNDIGQFGAQALFQQLVTHTTIISINISSLEGLNRNRLGPQGVQYLEELLQKNEILQFLNLSATMIGIEGLTYILNGLKFNQTLCQLDLSQNQFGPDCGILLGKSLPFSELKSLNLSGNKISDKGIKDIVVMFRSPIGQITKLEILDLSDNKITVLGLSKIFEVLPKNNHLKKLILNKNDFSGRGFTSLVTLLWENKCLTHLYMNNCDLEPAIGESLGNGLTKNETIQVLSLSDNNLKDDGVQALSEGIKTHIALKYIDLTNNKIRDDGAKALAGALKQIKSLEYLLLRNNNLRDAGGSYLVEALQYNKQIRKLNVERNPIGYKYINEIIKIVQINNNQYKQQLQPKFMNEMDQLLEFQQQKAIIDEEMQYTSYKQRELQQELDRIKQNNEEYKKEQREEYEKLSEQLEELFEEQKCLDKQIQEIDKYMRQLENFYADDVKLLEQQKEQNQIEISGIEREIKILKETLPQKKKSNLVKLDKLTKEFNELNSLHLLKEAEYQLQEKNLLLTKQKLESYQQEDLKKKQEEEDKKKISFKSKDKTGKKQMLIKKGSKQNLPEKKNDVEESKSQDPTSQFIEEVKENNYDDNTKLNKKLKRPKSSDKNKKNSKSNTKKSTPKSNNKKTK